MYSKLLLACFLTLPLGATLTVSLAPSTPSPQPVGTSITWTPTAQDGNSGTIDYRFRVASKGGSYQTMQDFDVASTFTWTPYQRENSFSVQVVARNTSTGQTAMAAVPYVITARTTVSGGNPVITPTANPLVGLFSAPGCPSGSTMDVLFTSSSTSQRTPAVPCSPTATTNVYVAGMIPSTTYNLNYEVTTNGSVSSGPILTFTTGAIPANLTFPAISVPTPGSPDTQQGIVLINALPGQVAGQNYFPFATDLNGNVIWYYSGVPPTDPYNIRPVTGGTILMLVANPAKLNLSQQFLKEIDLAGNTIRSTSTQRLSQQLTTLGRVGIVALNHDVIRLANGHTIVIASQEKIYPAGTQGSPGTVDILGDCIIDLDTNLNVTWSWSAYDHLNINRPAVLGETCKANVFGCPPLHLASIANDWTHGNSLFYTADGNILFSSRHQDFVYKINYANGTGDGSVIWTLGLGGDFTINGISDPYPWFSHQHDVEFGSIGTGVLTLFDNGNTRVAANPGQDSRGQVLLLDEVNKIATLNLNLDIGAFSVAVGSAQQLDNGDVEYDAGWIVTGQTSAAAHTIETNPFGAVNYEIDDSTRTYRTYRMSTMYSIP